MDLPHPKSLLLQTDIFYPHDCVDIREQGSYRIYSANDVIGLPPRTGCKLPIKMQKTVCGPLCLRKTVPIVQDLARIVY